MHFISNRPFWAQVSNKSSSFLFVICVLIVSACRDTATDPNEKKTYYDLKGFIDNQIVYLNEKRPKVTKTVRLNGKKEVRLLRARLGFLR